MDPIFVAITGLGHEVGELTVTNDDVAQRLLTANTQKKARSTGTADASLDQAEVLELSTTDEWIQQRAGIKERRYTTRSTSQLAAAAIRQAVADANRHLNDLEFILVATVSPDHPYSPPTGCLTHGDLGLDIKDELGIKSFLPVDISDACSSFGAALILGHSLIASGKYTFGVVVGADKMSTTFDPSDRAFSILLGDAAAVLALQAVSDPKLDSFPYGPNSFFFGTDPAGAENIMTPAGGSARPLTLDALQQAETSLGTIRPDRLVQKGRTVFKEMINFVPGMVVGALKRVGLTLNEIDIIFPHQANLRLNEPIEARLRELGLRKDAKVWNTIQLFGNTTSAAIPLGMSLAWEAYELEPGMVILLLYFGGGYTFGCIPIRWTAEPFIVGV